MLSRVSRLSRHLDRERRAALDESGLEAWEFDVLAALRRAGEPLTPGQLVTQNLVSSGTMTHRISRLVERGLVERVPDAADGRSVRVLLTEGGTAAVDRAMSDLVARERALLAPLDEPARSALVAALRTLLLPLDD